MNENKGKKIILYCVSIVVVLVAIIAIIPNVSSKKEESIEYTQEANIDYSVELEENDFNIENTNKYIASLINDVRLNFDYKANLKEDNLDYKLKYRIEANVVIKENESKEIVYNYNEVLLDEKVLDAHGNKDARINELQIIDYNSFNDIAKSFNSSYDLTDVSSTLDIKMFISFDDVEGIKKNETVLSASMPLTTKTVKIEITDNTSELSNKASLTKEEENNKLLFVFVLIGALLLEAYLIYLLVTFILNTRNEETYYYSEVSKIENGYESYIQKVVEPITNLYKNDESIKVYTIESFVDMLEIRDNLNSPILMYQHEKQLQTDFAILDLQNKIIYVHTIKGNK